MAGELFNIQRVELIGCVPFAEDIKVPLNLLVALEFVELIAANPFAAVNVQLVQVIAPLKPFENPTFKFDADIVEFVIVTVPVEEFETPGADWDWVVEADIVEFVIFKMELAAEFVIAPKKRPEVRLPPFTEIVPFDALFTQYPLSDNNMQLVKFILPDEELFIP